MTFRYRKGITRLLHGAAICLFVVALTMPALESANGFGMRTVEYGWRVLFVASGFDGALSNEVWIIFGPFGILLNVFLLMWSVNALRRDEPTPPRRMVNGLGVVLVAMSVLVCWPAKPRPINWIGPTRMYIGAYLWLAALWLSWIAAILSSEGPSQRVPARTSRTG
jgi:hypothetical protein